jgi:hypothetical protein
VREVTLLNEGHRETAARGIQRDTAPGHATSDDEDVDGRRGELVELTCPPSSREMRARHGRR